MTDKLVINKKEKALLIGVIYEKLNQLKVEEHLRELELLAKTAGAKVVGKVTQKLSRINPSYFIGTGKAEQIIKQAEELGVSLIIFDDELSPAQIKNYSNLVKNIKVIDRNALILDIFRQHAKTKEAKTQVELAQLEYMLPRLTRAWTHLERQMGGIGARAGAGETQIEVDRRLIRTRISKLKKELNKIDKERETQSKNRLNEFKVALVGYTNAGKSTLINSLAEQEVAMVSEIPGTTRDTVNLSIENKGKTYIFIDTAGLRRKSRVNEDVEYYSTSRAVG